METHGKRLEEKVRGKIYKTVVRPAGTYGLDMVTLSKKQEAEVEVAEMKIL